MFYIRLKSYLGTAGRDSYRYHTNFYTAPHAYNGMQNPQKSHSSSFRYDKPLDYDSWEKHASEEEKELLRRDIQEARFEIEKAHEAETKKLGEQLELESKIAIEQHKKD